MKKLLLNIIQYYRNTFPKSASCRFSPSCSTYAYEIIEKEGVFKGVCKSFKRLLKCNTLFTPVVGTHDPVN